MNYAQELQNKELYIDAYLKPVLNADEAVYQQFNVNNSVNFNSLTFSKNGFPIHKLLFAAISPFFRTLFKDHYFEHKENCVTILLPETSPLILYYVIRFVYTHRLDIPSSLYSEVLQLAKFLQITSLIDELYKNSRKTSFSFKKKQTDTETKHFNIYSHTNNLLIEERQSRIISEQQHESNIYDLHSSEMKSESNIPSHSFMSSPKDSGNSYGFNSQEVRKNLLQSNVPQVCKSSVPVKNATNEPLTQNSSYWINGSSNDSIPRNLIILEPNNKTKNVLLVANTATQCDSFLKAETQESQNNIFYPGNSEIETLQLEASEKTLPSNLAIDDMPTVLTTEHFSESSYSTSNVVTSTLIMPVNEAKQTAVETVKDEQLPLSFHESSQDRVNCSDSAVVGLQLSCNQEEEEEEKLKLQVLLKECEGMDLAGRNFTERPVTPTCYSVSPLCSSTSEDFTDRINEWVQGNMLKSQNKAAPYKDEEDSRGRKNQQTIHDSGESDGFKQENEAQSQTHTTKILGEPQEGKEKGPKLKKFACKKCDVVSFTKADFLIHKSEHRNKILKCKVCPKTFKSRYGHDLLLHEARHRSPTLPCKICSKTFKLKKDLTAHMKRHEGEPKFKCKVCDKRLCSQRNLKMHITKIHENQKPFKCEFCPKLYGKRCSLKVHIRSVHTREKPYQCPSCPKAFASTELLAVHKLIHASYFQYICSICKKGFHSFANLYHHKKVHLKEKGFSCTICKLQFDTRLMLLGHKLTHKKLSHPLKCRHCDQTFNVKESYEMHMLSVHKEKVKIAEINVKKIQVSTGEHATNRQFPTNGLRNSNIHMQTSQNNDLNLARKFSQNDNFESKIKNCKPFKLIYWPEQKTGEINPLIAGNPNIKLNVIQTENKRTLVKSPLCKLISAGRKPHSTSSTADIPCTEERDQSNRKKVPVTFNNQNFNSEIDSFIQNSNYQTVGFLTQRPSSNLSIKENDKLSSNLEAKFTEKECLRYSGEERTLLKGKSFNDHKLTDDFSLSCYSTQEEGSQFSIANCAKPGSNSLVDVFSSKCSNEVNNVEKFLFDINLLSELP